MYLVVFLVLVALVNIVFASMAFENIRDEDLSEQSHMIIYSVALAIGAISVVSLALLIASYYYSTHQPALIYTVLALTVLQLAAFGTIVYYLRTVPEQKTIYIISITGAALSLLALIVSPIVMNMTRDKPRLYSLNDPVSRYISSRSATSSPPRKYSYQSNKEYSPEEEF